MKNVSTAGEGEEKTYMKPNIYIRMYLNHFAGEHIAHFHPTINWAITWKKKLYLSLKVFCTKVLLFLRLQLETGPPFYVVIRATRRSSRLHCKGSVFISQLFLSILVRPGNRTRHLPLCSQALILPCWDDFTSIFFGDYNGEHIRLIWKMIKR